MGALAANVGQTAVGTCCGHGVPPCIPSTGMISIGAFTVLTEGAPTARIGDLVVTACGHTALVASGSPTVFAEGLPVARIGDSVAGIFNGTIVSGAATVLVA